MNEAETRAEYIDPKLKESGWGDIDGSRILREYRITDGRIQVGAVRSKPEIADYILIYNNQKLAIIEAKSLECFPTEGIMQAKSCAEKLHLEYAYSTNGKEIYEVNMKTGKEKYVDKFPSPEELWNKIFSDFNEWSAKFSQIPFEDLSGTKILRYYQEIAVNNTLGAIAENKNRVLLTLATGTGKTFIAFQIAWKLFHSRWNLQKDGSRRPRILFLADRNNLADQAYNNFSAFPDDALVRISPDDIRKKGKVPTNGSIFFTIFQTFMSGQNNTPYFGEYPKDFFDLVIIDECHRGGANDESNWRSILEYFSPALQIGLTATPKREGNIDTYRYFGEPVYIYSLKEGINDGFLTPFRMKQIKTTLDEYMYVSDDKIIEGEIEEGKIYEESDFNKLIEIKEREAKRVKIIMDEINQKEKTIIFCATQDHALAVRDLINQMKESSDPNYCVRVTANDGAKGDQFLRDFQDNEKTIPTILTTSQKLSTGVDARNIRNIVLMRPINSMIEFKQIIGRGTRLFDGKEYFTVYDFVEAYKHFADPEWDGEPIDNTKEKGPISDTPGTDGEGIIVDPEPPQPPRKKIKITLADGKERQIQHMISTSFWGSNGKPISAKEFLQNLFGSLTEFYKNEEELRKIWSDPVTRKEFLEKISDAGFSKGDLETLQKLINAEDSDLFDVLSYVSFATSPVTRKARVEDSRGNIFDGLEEKQKEFIEFVLNKYIMKGVEELAEEKLPGLLNLKYHSISDAERLLGGVEKIRRLYFEFQRGLYLNSNARK
ncbi:MAG: DEAD/DEAH box helicase family protein [Bacteroidota bacterium]|nr:DEAD/DEAH box helicase family protein [Bacteroidota bacterium]